MFETFLHENQILIGVLALLNIMLAYDVFKGAKTGAKRMLGLELPLLQRENDVYLLDVSSAENFSKGHIGGSTNFPFKTFSLEEKKFKAKKDQTIVVVDESGMNAGSIARKLIDDGFSDVRTLNGGIATWKTDNFPLIIK